MRTTATDNSDSSVELSFVIPVYNGAARIRRLVERVHGVACGMSFEVVLVNDGSADDSETVCAELARQRSQTVTFVHLNRNFGEHHAVLAGLNYARGKFVGTLDDDWQLPPEEILRMLQELKQKNLDVVYGRCINMKRSWWRNWGSRFNSWMATFMLHKPRKLYLSGFKVMNRFTVDEIVKYRGPFPYIDGLIYRVTRNVGELPVEHRVSEAGRSRHTMRTLVALWSNMFLNYSIAPLRLAGCIGLMISCFGIVLLALVWIGKIWITEVGAVGTSTVIGALLLFSGIEVVMLGLVGEYLGRLYLDYTGMPQFVVRYTIQQANHISGTEPTAVETRDEAQS